MACAASPLDDDDHDATVANLAREAEEPVPPVDGRQSWTLKVQDQAKSFTRRLSDASNIIAAEITGSQSQAGRGGAMLTKRQSTKWGPGPEEPDPPAFKKSSRSFGNMKEYPLRAWCHRLLRSPRFDLLIGCIIGLNTLFVGLEQHHKFHGGDASVRWLTFFAAMEHVFLVIYILEISLRFFVGGLLCLRDSWTRFDFVLVIMGVLTNWILEPIMGNVNLLVLKIARLCRLARVVRLLVKFRELWMLLRGLMNCGRTMFYTVILLIMVLYVFAVVGVEFITSNRLAAGPEADPVFAGVVNESFYSLAATMLTLLRFVTMDDVYVFMEPLVQQDFVLVFYFGGIIMVVSIALMNLVTAVIVNSALEQAVQDKEAMRAREQSQRKRLVRELREIFIRIDEDHSGEVSRDEIEQINEDDRQLLAEATKISDPMEIFDSLDIDNKGAISIDEFCEGIWQVMISQTPIEVKRVEQHVVAMRLALKNAEVAQNTMLKLMGRLQGVVDETLEACSGRRPSMLAPGAEAYEPGFDASLRSWGFSGFHEANDIPEEAQLRATVFREAMSTDIRHLREDLHCILRLLLSSAPPQLPPRLATSSLEGERLLNAVASIVDGSRRHQVMSKPPWPASSPLPPSQLLLPEAAPEAFDGSARSNSGLPDPLVGLSGTRKDPDQPSATSSDRSPGRPATAQGAALPQPP